VDVNLFPRLQNQEYLSIGKPAHQFPVHGRTRQEGMGIVRFCFEVFPHHKIVVEAHSGFLAKLVSFAKRKDGIALAAAGLNVRARATGAAEHAIASPLIPACSLAMRTHHRLPELEALRKHGYGRD